MKKKESNSAIELKQWSEQISSFKRLKLKDAQELYKKAINSNNEEEKKVYMDELILGTLYVVYGYIKRSDLDILTSASYDMSDIISAFNEVWINKLYNGELLNVDNYSSLFKSAYFNEVYNKLGGSEISVNGLFGISIECFIDLLALYIEYRNKFKIIDFYNIIKDEYSYIYDDVIKIIPFLDLIYNNLNFDKKNDISLNKTKIFNYLRIIINLGLKESISNELIDNNIMEDKVLNDIMFEHFIDDVDQVLTDDRMKQIIHDRFGLDDNNPLCLDTIGNTYGITGTRVGQLEAKALKRLRNNRNIRKSYGEN